MGWGVDVSGVCGGMGELRDGSGGTAGCGSYGV